MTIRAALAVLAAGVTAGTVAGVMVPAVAQASPEAPSGRYQYESSIPQNSGVWTFTPCGADCTSAASAKATYQFHYSDGRWTYRGPSTGTCGDGTPLTAEKQSSFDAETLAGMSQNTLTSDACGVSAGTASQPETFQLTKL